MNMNRTMAAVIRAPREAGLSIPNIANTVWVEGEIMRFISDVIMRFIGVHVM